MKSLKLVTIVVKLYVCLIACGLGHGKYMYLSYVIFFANMSGSQIIFRLANLDQVMHT